MRWVWVAGLALMAAGCGGSARQPPSPLELSQLPPEQAAIRVQAAWLVAGDAPRLLISMDPVSHRHQIVEGELVAEWSPMDLHPVAEMRTCLAIGEACLPDGPWRPYRLVEEHDLPADIDGPVWIGLEFRRADGASVPSFYTPGALYKTLQLQLELGSPGAELSIGKAPEWQLADATLFAEDGVIG